MEAMTPPVDCIGLALDLEQQATLATSQTVERAMLAAAIGLRRIDAHLAQPAQAVDVGVRPICQNSAESADLLTNTSKLVGEVAAAWRLRIGNSDVWSFCTEEWQADFYGKQSGLPYEKEPLYTRALSGEKAGPVGDGKARAFALHAAVGAIYFADSSDYLSALWEVVRELAPDLVDELSVDPSAVWHRTMAATDRFTLPASPTPDKEGA